jgi:hypothetical protein
MTSDAMPSTNTAGLSPADLLHMAQNPKTPVEVLQQILEHTALSPEILMALLRHPQTPGHSMADLAERAEGPLLDILLGGLDRMGRWIEALEALLRNPNVPELKHPTIQGQLDTARKRDAEGGKKNLLLRIKDLPVGQKLTLAKRGNKNVRMILIKDANEMVALEVAASPRITDGEILSIAMMRDVSDKVLRYIASNRKYRQNREILVALVNNPRTPVGVTLSLGLHQLSDRELTDLAKNRNVPGAVSRAAKTIIDRRKGGGQPGGGGGH